MLSLDNTVNYREFRLNKLFSPEYRHILMLLYWPIYGLVFLFLERFYEVDTYINVYCRLDDMIPFCEYFVIPYLFWFVLLIGMIVYTFFFDVDTLRRMMMFIIVTYTFALVVYFIFPTCQQLRPVSFERDNIFTRFLASFYLYDTNTNVCPSIHVIGSFAAAAAAWRAKHLRHPAIRCFFVTAAILICISTLLIKQHSVIDVLAGCAVNFAAYPFFFREDNTRREA